MVVWSNDSHTTEGQQAVGTQKRVAMSVNAKVWDQLLLCHYSGRSLAVPFIFFFP